ncbi:hypothetical protein HPB50_020166 [Hyalomma asiaticum]|uniref:Uncharacterized protein n=1 Tax=Hyalomma asiaticum TaxID=266040 RepID=A0ACB7TRU1_HYAAI|nr:hypothetical protein HPB50_020166 [Hyalomma asiaticum]
MLGIDLQIVHSCNPRGSDRNGRIWPAAASHAGLFTDGRRALGPFWRRRCMLPLRKTRLRVTPKSLSSSPPRRRRRCTTQPAARFSDTHPRHRRCVLSEHELATCHHEPAAAGRGPGTSGGTSESRAQRPTANKRASTRATCYAAGAGFWGVCHRGCKVHARPLSGAGGKIKIKVVEDALVSDRSPQNTEAWLRQMCSPMIYGYATNSTESVSPTAVKGVPQRRGLRSAKFTLHAVVDDVWAADSDL